MQDAVRVTDLRCPENVVRYLQTAGAVGRQQILSAHIVHDGEFRLKPKQRWFPIKGEYRFSPLEPSFTWKATIKIVPLIFISVVDEYENGIGRNHVRLESLFTIGDNAGPEVDESSLGRLLSEFVLMPTTLVPCERLRWEQIDSKSSRAVLVSQNMQAIAIFDFDEDGLPWKVTVDRFGTFDGKIEKRPFVIRLSKYQLFEGFLIPTDIVGSWLMSDAEFTWLHFVIKSAAFK